MKKVLLRFRRF